MTVLLDWLLSGFFDTVQEVLLAVAPLAVIFVIAQVTLLHLRGGELRRLIMGLGLAGLGLLLFLHGVHITFIPVGQAVGESLVTTYLPWWLVPIGFVLGVVATVAEPAVRILTDEVNKVSAGALPPRLILVALALGVGCSVALAMARTILDFPLWYVLVPGYILALLLTRWSRPSFVSIAFDAGGVATGPMIVTFVVALGVGAAAGFPDRDPIVHGFGMIALVALTPILSLVVLGLFYGRRGKEEQRHAKGTK